MCVYNLKNKHAKKVRAQLVSPWHQWQLGKNFNIAVSWNQWVSIRTCVSPYEHASLLKQRRYSNFNLKVLSLDPGYSQESVFLLAAKLKLISNRALQRTINNWPWSLTAHPPCPGHHDSYCNHKEVTLSPRRISWMPWENQTDEKWVMCLHDNRRYQSLN